MKGNSDHFIRLVAKGVEYFGPVDLTQYYVKNFSIAGEFADERMIKEEVTAVKVEIVLGRRVFTQLFITFLPTVCLCIAAFSTNFFNVKLHLNLVLVENANL